MALGKSNRKLSFRSKRSEAEESLLSNNDYLPHPPPSSKVGEGTVLSPYFRGRKRGGTLILSPRA